METFYDNLNRMSRKSCSLLDDLNSLYKEMLSKGSRSYETNCETKLCDTTENNKDNIYELTLNGEKVNIMTPDGYKKFVDFMEANRMGDGFGAIGEIINSALDETLSIVGKEYEKHQASKNAGCVPGECECNGCTCHNCDDFALDIPDDTKRNFDKIIDAYFAAYAKKLAFVDKIEEESMRNRLRHFLGYVYNV